MDKEVKETKESFVTNEYGKVTRIDKTEVYSDGSSKTTEYDAYSGLIIGPIAIKEIGVTYNEPDGTSKHVEK